METLGTMHVSQCEHEFWLGMDENTWFVGEFENHTNPCHSEILSLADIPTEVVNFYATTYQLNQDELPVTVRDIGALYPDRTRLIQTIFQRMGMNIEEIPPAIGLFADLPASQADAGLLEFAYAEGFLLECDLEPLKICPEMAATREEAALAVIRGLWGEEHIPPPATGIFEDVYIGSPYAPWIEEMYRMEITPGCSSDPMKYCPYLRFNYVELDEFITKALTITK